MKPPDEEVTDRIINRLREKGLLSEPVLTKLKANLASGKLSSEDWKVTVETDRPTKEEEPDSEGK